MCYTNGTGSSGSSISPVSHFLNATIKTVISTGRALKRLAFDRLHDNKYNWTIWWKFGCCHTTPTQNCVMSNVCRQPTVSTRPQCTTARSSSRTDITVTRAVLSTASDLRTRVPHGTHKHALLLRHAKVTATRSLSVLPYCQPASCTT
jgi:hypothetical protein